MLHRWLACSLLKGRRMRLALISLVFLSAACRDECSNKTDPGHCEGNVAVNCPEPGVDQLVPVRWSHVDCDTHVCVQAGTSALCALDAGTSPFCASGASTETCDGVTQVRCSVGFEVEREACLSCDLDGGICHGGPSSKCAGDSDCTSAFFCRDAGSNSYCTKR